MAGRLAAAAALVALAAACGGSPSPRASSSPTPTATTAKPKPKPKPTSATPKATPSRTPSPTPAPTTRPPATGTPLGTAGALVRLVDPGQPRSGSDCKALAPDLASASCAAVKTAGGTLISATGRIQGEQVIRLLVPSGQGYVPRYEGRDAAAAWTATRVFAAPLTGRGDDGVVVFVRLADGRATYDVLTWVQGGPLVLRAHRKPIADGRLAAADGALEEYELARDGSFVRRRIAWDGRRFLLAPGTRSTTPPPR